jgi:hypothetical protein
MRRILVLGVFILAIAALASLAQTKSASAQTTSAQPCSPTAPLGLYQAIQATCSVTAPSQLVPPQTVYVASPSYNGATPVACQGVNGASYTTQGTTTTLPPTLGLASSGQTACSFQITAGLVPAGAPVGTEVVSVPSSVSGSTVQLTSYLCGDPTCGTGFNPLQPPAPPTLVTIVNASPTSPCLSSSCGAYGAYPNPYVYPGNSINPYTYGPPPPPVGSYPHHPHRHHGDSDGDNDGD